jgi:hypothetical protein
LILRNKKIISLENNILLPFTIEECDFNWEKWKKDWNLREFCQKKKFKSILDSLEK